MNSKENRYKFLFGELVSDKLISSNDLYQLEKLDDTESKLVFCADLLKKKKLFVRKNDFSTLSFYEYLASFENEIIINDKILVKLIMCENDRQKILVYENLYQIKKALYINNYQCEILKVRCRYNLDYALNNLNIYHYKDILNRIDQNVSLYHKRKSNSKEKKSFSEDELWFTKHSIRAILTPMYS